MTLKDIKEKLEPIIGKNVQPVSLRDSLACVKILGYGSVCYIKDDQGRKYYLVKIDENSYLDVSAYIAGDKLRELTEGQVIAQSSDQKIHAWED